MKPRQVIYPVNDISRTNRKQRRKMKLTERTEAMFKFLLWMLTFVFLLVLAIFLLNNF